MYSEEFSSLEVIINIDKKFKNEIHQYTSKISPDTLKENFLASR